MKKRLSAILLAVCLALTMLPASVFAENVATDTSWYNTTDTAFTLNDEAELLGFVSIANGTAEGITKDNFKNKTVTLGDDMDLAGIDWTPISSFAGTFDGNEKTIYHLTPDADTSTNLGLFDTLSAGTIQDLTLDTVTVTANRQINFGSIVRSASTGSTLVGCHVKNVTVTINTTTGWNRYIGGLAGTVLDASKVEDCSVENFTLTARNTCYDGMGGLIGRFYISSAKADQYPGSLKRCKVTGFTANIAELAGHNSGGAGCNSGGNFGGVGGMLGYGHSGNDSSALPIEDCHVSKLNITVGKMYDHSFVGGFLGMSRRRYAATNCSASGQITVGSADGCTKCYVGGFCGAPTGADTGATNAWATKADAITFTSCSSNVNITATGSCVAGGFTGLAGASFQEGSAASWANVKFTGCTASGTIFAEKEAGGFAGSADRGAYGTGCDVSGVTIAAASSGTKINTKINDDATGGSGMISGADGITPAASTIVPPEGKNLTTGTDGSIVMPAGTTVTKTDGTPPETLANGGELGKNGTLASYASTLALEESALELYVRESAVLTVTVDPAGSLVKWCSSDESVATVDESGTVTAKRSGTVTITAASGKAGDACVVTVHSHPSPSRPSHAITVTNGVGGSVTVKRDSAHEGGVVAVTVEPADGYTLESLTVTDAEGNELAVTALSGNQSSFIMPGGEVTIRAAFTGDEPVGFVDVPAGKYFYSAVNWAASGGITGGTDATHFSPYALCTRAQIITFLWRAAGEPKAESGKGFHDVAAGRSCTEAVLWAAENEIVGGYDDGAFRPDGVVSRQQVAAILWRFAKYSGMDVSVGEDTNILSYNDAFDVSEYAIPALQWACGANVLGGNGGDLLPHDSCTRAQIVTMLYRLLAE